MLLSEVQCDTQEEEDWVYSCLETLPNGFFFLLFPFVTVCLRCLIRISGKRSSVLKLCPSLLSKCH